MPARLPPNYTRWVDTVGCHTCQAIFEYEGLNDGDFFECPKCGAVETFVAGYMWPQGSSLGIAWFDDDGNPLPPNPEEERIRAWFNEMLASMKSPDAPLEPPDPLSPPPALAPLGHETNPESDRVLSGLMIAGSVAALFVAALAILAVNGAFERPRPPSPSPPPLTPERLAARISEVAEREARELDAASVLREWPEELESFSPRARQFFARMEVPEGGSIGIGGEFYRFERSREGYRRFVRIEQPTPGPPTAEAVESADEAATPEPLVEAP